MYLELLYTFWKPIYPLLDKIFSFDRTAAMREITTTDNVLELGIGTGLNLPYYPPCNVTGVDFSSMITRAEKQTTQATVTLKQVDARSLPFTDNTFDVALATFFFRVTPEPKKVLQETARVVKPGGKLLIVDVFKDGADVWRLVTLLLGWGQNHDLKALLADTPWTLQTETPLGKRTKLLILQEQDRS